MLVFFPFFSPGGIFDTFQVSLLRYKINPACRGINYFWFVMKDAVNNAND